MSVFVFDLGRRKLINFSLFNRIKAFTPVSVLLVSAAFKLKELNAKILCIVGIISVGVVIASYGEIDFELIGFLVQVSYPYCYPDTEHHN